MDEIQLKTREGNKGGLSEAGKGPRRRGGGEEISRRRRGTLSREAIVTTAMRIADEEGLEAVSIRRIAAELDARPMSLYDHIASKDELLGLMSDEVTEGVLIEGPMPGEWREALALISRHNYVVLVAHPWLVMTAPISHRHLGQNAVRAAKQYVEALEPLDLDPTELWLIAGTVNDYLVGNAHRAANLPRKEETQESIPESELREFPELSSLPDSFRSRASIERFQGGLQIVLDGIEGRFVGHPNHR